MRVLRLVAGVDPSSGGPAVSSVASACAAEQAGVATTIAIPVADRGRITVGMTILERYGVNAQTFEVCRVWRSKCAGYGVSGRLMRWARAEAQSFDIVHTHGAWTYTTLRGLRLAKAAGRPAVLTPHETLTNFDIAKSHFPIRLIKRGLRALYLNTFDLVIFTSRLEARDSEVERMRSRVVVIPHPLFAPARPQRRFREPGNAGLCLGYLGRFDPKKNVDLLLETIADLPPRVVLKVAGDGPFAASHRARARALAIDDRVEWLGFIGEEAKVPFFDSIDLLAMPSSYECFGMAAAEALAAGVPVLVSTRTGIAEMVRRHDCGYVVEPLRSDFRSALEAILTSPEDLRARGERAIRAANVELSLASHGRSLKEQYEFLLKPQVRTGTAAT